LDVNGLGGSRVAVSRQDYIAINVLPFVITLMRERLFILCFDEYFARWNLQDQITISLMDYNDGYIMHVL
jgi:ABC-type Mn2+/Zn2+ transport system permease subunit